VVCFCYFHFFDIFPLFFFAQDEVAACCLDARNVPGLPGIPPIEHDKAWAIVEELCVKVIDEVRGAERESLSWIRMTRTARQDARRSGKEDAGHSLFLEE